MDGRFTVIVVDGHAADFSDVYTDSVRYDGLSWPDSVELARLSFTQGFEVIVWKQDDDDHSATDDGGAGNAPA